MAAQIKEWERERSEEHAGPSWTIGDGGKVAASEEGNGAAELWEMGQAPPQTQQLMGMEQEAMARAAAAAGRDGSGCRQPAASSPVGAGSVASSGEDAEAEKFVFGSGHGGESLCAQRQRRS